MNIFVDENMPYAKEFFSGIGTVTQFSGRELSGSDIHDADVLLVRSITQVNQALVQEANKLQFVGTATIGEDHIDKALIKNRGIGFSSAPGCNAISVAEYVISAMFHLANKYQEAISGKTIAIIGVGNIGSALAKKLEVLDVDVLLVDPINTDKVKTLNSRYVSYEQALKLADIVTFHTPLTKDSPNATYHLLNTEHLTLLKENVTIINASRGAVIDNKALLNFKKARADVKLVLDVWESEPTPLKELIPFCDIRTAHIAGYSLEGKARGTEMLYHAVCKHFGLQAQLTLDDFLPKPVFNQLDLNSFEALRDFPKITKLVYDIERDNRLFDAYLLPHGFDWLRKNYPIRREWSSLQLKVEEKSTKKAQISQFGFAI